MSRIVLKNENRIGSVAWKFRAANPSVPAELRPSQASRTQPARRDFVGLQNQLHVHVEF